MLCVLLWKFIIITRVTPPFIDVVVCKIEAAALVVTGNGRLFGSVEGWTSSSVGDSWRSLLGRYFYLLLLLFSFSFLWKFIFDGSLSPSSGQFTNLILNSFFSYFITGIKIKSKKKKEKRKTSKVVGLGHQPVRIDPAANNNNNNSTTTTTLQLSTRPNLEMMPETITLHGDADGRPMVIGEGPQHQHKNKQAREFEFVFGCELYFSLSLLSIEKSMRSISQQLHHLCDTKK